MHDRACTHCTLLSHRCQAMLFSIRRKEDGGEDSKQLEFLCRVLFAMRHSVVDLGRVLRTHRMGHWSWIRRARRLKHQDWPHPSFLFRSAADVHAKSSRRLVKAKEEIRLHLTQTWGRWMMRQGVSFYFFCDGMSISCRANWICRLRCLAKSCSSCSIHCIYSVVFSESLACFRAPLSKN